MYLGFLIFVDTISSSPLRKASIILCFHWFLIVIVGARISVGLFNREIISIPKVVFPAPGAATTCNFLSRR